MDPDTEQLLDLVRGRDAAARDLLLGRHRARLRALVALRMDPRLRGRLDASDVVQESLAEADRRLPEYLLRRPLPFYPWLRRLALERLAQVYRTHVRAQKRSVEREERSLSWLPEGPAGELCVPLAGPPDGSPSARLRHEDLRRRLCDALDRLGERDREVIALRHLEQLSVREMAAVLGITEGAVKVRHVRALERLRALLEAGGEGEAP
jgi:RNA polymerase sigma-70 factor (ECF subfamily)